ncbi:cytochrome b/b6 domain-containing protein [Vibrio crassostreae]|uniref:cytochrome b/b6 domain-containing protein n=1 Tax=Vibrio crassostreae TaxID=246167 RepID=UPI0006368A52|nr:cytochrome b/b6 domain-containing protein [Vibrio crassostreae]TCO03064.1 cytochrome b [Vibrio crassostreae]CAK1745859.1 Cytochrome b [Vibrio crassostreae]CAK1746948.1 Cytochrome b [Vibrio crassostreae]CAK1747496.1 Cytochrome b [Vibrio crassostreae]CAK2148155.1 Cytochrome b [Vibrio crassostreae]
MKIWDLPTRLYHWLQATLFIGLAASGFSGNGPHIYLGLALFSLILWRLVWGMIGSDTSRFSQFMSSPRSAWLYLRGRVQPKPGHNPLGAWMVIGMITTLFIQCMTGLVIAGFFDAIPGSELVITDAVFDVLCAVHGIAARMLVVFVVLHLVAIIIYKLRSKPLVLAMITGKQNQSLSTAHSGNGTQLAFSSNRKALLVLIASVLVTMTIVVMS